MKKHALPAKYCLPTLCLLLANGMEAQETPVTLQVDLENQVRYAEDVTDRSQIARSPVPVPTTPALNFNRGIVISDIIAVNGSPAKGAAVNLVNDVRLSPNAAPGAAISDVVLPAFSFATFQFLKPNGDLIGSISCMGAAGPTGMTIVGGTGAFVGVKGTVIATGGGTPLRITSQAEDPSMRRMNGGGRGSTLIQIFPMFRPEVLTGANGPVIIHSDYTAISSDKPARPGEVLILYAIGLGPTTPSVNPGDTFPGPPFAVVTSPVEVLVNGKPSPAINQIGLPGTSDIYHVAFRVPDDTTAGIARVQISSAWVKGSAVAIPVR